MIYHNEDLSSLNFLITGGAGFIGSNLVDYLLRHNAGLVRVLDNLSNGYYKNIEKYSSLKNFEFIKGDIRDFNTCKNAIENINYVSHQAALGSVPRSIKDPLTSNEVNINGFLNILNCVKNSKTVIRMVYAASSSTYGDSKSMPKKEETIGKPLSPYAVTKLVNEIYADVFEKAYDLKTIGLRYFNVFGPKQFSNNPYAAVIPLFTDSIINNKIPVINGDINISRDFTYVENVVQANIKALLINKIECSKVYNVACGQAISLIEIINNLNSILGKKIIPTIGPHRDGDIMHSLASIDKIKKELNYSPFILFKEGLEKTIKWNLKNG
jgi:UDP-N-acetylglucosamine/UDP-N-acetylgalactosamine 4-epimerase